MPNKLTEEQLRNLKISYNSMMLDPKMTDAVKKRYTLDFQKQYGEQFTPIATEFSQTHNHDFGSDFKADYGNGIDRESLDDVNSRTVIKGIDNAHISNPNNNAAQYSQFNGQGDTDITADIGSSNSPVAPRRSTGGVSRPTTDLPQFDAKGVDIGADVQLGLMGADVNNSMKKINPVAGGGEAGNMSATTGIGKGSEGVGNALGLASLAAQGINAVAEAQSAHERLDNWYEIGVDDPVYDRRLELDKNIDDSNQQADATNAGARVRKRVNRSMTSSNAANANIVALDENIQRTKGAAKTAKVNAENQLINKEIMLNDNTAKGNSQVKRQYLQDVNQHEKDYIVGKNAIDAKEFGDINQLAQAVGEYGAEREYIDLEGVIHSDTNVDVWTEGGYVDNQGNKISKPKYKRNTRKAKRIKRRNK